MEPKSNETPPSEKTSVNMDALTQSETFPEVKQNAIDAVAAQQAAQTPAAPPPGAQLNKDGSVKQKRGRKPKADSVASPAPRSQVGSRPQPTSDTVPPVDSTQEAVMISGLLEQMTCKLISDEWKLSDQERTANILAWKNCLDHYGGLKLSPPQMLVINHMGIIMVRAGQKETRTKIQKIGDWVKKKMLAAKFKGWKNALSGSREDPEREDNVREEKSAQS